MSLLKFLVISSVVATAFSQTDWCTFSYCSANTHIACKNKGLFDPSCMSPVSIKLTAAQMNLLVDGHNSLRNTVASGMLSGFASARRMAKMTWNTQLAQFADLNTKQCKIAHDKCRNTPSFKYSGQNLAIMSTTGNYTIEAVINGSFKMWFDEFKNANMDNINKVGTPLAKGGVIGHFTAMVTERSTQVGCAMSSFKTTSGSRTFNSYLLACNYASTNMGGWPVYKTGAKASGCIGGADSTFTGLCKTSEPIDPNTNS